MVDILEKEMYNMSSARPTFEEALTQLNVELIKMGATVEKSIMDAVEAFKNHDEKLAKDIVAKDRIVDDMEKYRGSVSFTYFETTASCR